MVRDFYATLAQVLPVLLLAFVWDSGYLARLGNQERHHRRHDSAHGVRFWTKGRVRAYALLVTTALLADLGLCALVLADLIQDSWTVRTLALSGLGLALVTILTRVTSDILASTRPSEAAPKIPDATGDAPALHDQPTST
ncbi:hypothetical protein [Nonomuraea sp. JJY05]|jgi:hypothetical protein|uniref:hypothetical protein n=1 Tax=Nonomuraea sp. JJY05 TaxID=3350255 RepID=UPI00373E6A75